MNLILDGMSVAGIPIAILGKAIPIKEAAAPSTDRGRASIECSFRSCSRAKTLVLFDRGPDLGTSVET